jgi:hypothetical protein
MSVVLPAPLAPIMAMVSPSFEREVDAEERLEIAVTGGKPVDLRSAHTSIPR